MRILLSVLLIEVFLLGSGRLVQIGPLTLRMWLFAAALSCAILVTALRQRVDGEVLLLLLAFLTLTTTSSLIGLLDEVPVERVAEDVKPLLFFLSLLFFHVAIREPAQVAWIATLIRATSLILGLGYLALLGLIAAGVIPFGLVYEVLNPSGEVFFRGDSGAFYKGFLYLGVGFCFFLSKRTLGGRLACLLLIMAMILTFTRGLLLSVAVVLVATLFVRRQSLLRLQFNIGLLAIGGVITWMWTARTLADRAESDAIRLLDVHVIERSTTWLSLLVGHGLGSSIGDRERIEASYLEILHQQGIVGLLFWGGVGILILRNFLRAARLGRSREAEPFFLASLLVFAESVTNPFLTNPIGMCMVIVGLVVLQRLSEAGWEEIPSRAAPPQIRLPFTASGAALP